MRQDFQPAKPECFAFYRFHSAESLAAHERVHSGKKPFVCVVCRAAVSTKDHLDVHMRIHTGARPYTCQASYFVSRTWVELT